MASYVNEGGGQPGYPTRIPLSGQPGEPGLDPIGAIGGGLLGGFGGGSRPAGNTTTTTSQTLAPGGLQNIQDTIAGRYLDPSTNPYLTNTFNYAAQPFQDRINSMFESSGRYGSGAHQGLMQRGLGDLANQIYGGNYQQERARQFGAATSPIGNTVTSPYFTNPLGNILSGGLAGGVLGNLFGGSGGLGGMIGNWWNNLGGSGGGGGGGGGVDPNVDPNTGF